MKRFFCFALIAMLLIFSGCGKKDSGDLQSPDKIENPSTGNEMSQNELLNELNGEYVNSLFFDEFKKTKSMVKADTYQLFIAFRTDSEACSVIVGDGHQGDSLGGLKNIEYKDGKYEIYLERDEDNNAKISYTPGNDYLEAEIKFYVDVWSTKGETYKFLKHDSETNYKINSILFDEIKDVTFRDDMAYATINGTQYKLNVLTDLNASPLDFQKYDGIISLKDESNVYSEMAYKYNGGKIKLFDMNESFVAELK